MGSLEEGVTVIIRSVGERTEALCEALILNEVPKANVHLIRERPFGAAVRKTLELAIEKGRRWTLAVDADVLLRRHAIRDGLAWAETEKREFFFANFLVADKLLGEIRCGGAHLYRGHLLHEALRYADSSIDGHERPESLVRARMALAGVQSVQVHNLVVGLHGFEQSYRDIFRTSFVYALKHPVSHMECCVRAWQRLMNEDEDFRVALAGVRASMSVGGSPVIDDRLIPSSIREIEALSGVEEKPALPGDALDSRKIAQMLGEFSPFVERIRCAEALFLGEKRLSIPDQVGRRIRSLGLCRFWLFAFGSCLCRTGAILRSWAEKRLLKG